LTKELEQSILASYIAIAKHGEIIGWRPALINIECGTLKRESEE